MNTVPDISVLMIEDDPDDRYITETTFAESGYPVTLRFLDEPARFIRHLYELKEAGNLPSIIIINKELPGIDGLDLLSDLKANRDFKYIPAVIVSGLAFPKIVEESYRRGANSFIEKPDSGHLTRERINAFIRYWFGIVDLPGKLRSPLRVPVPKHSRRSHMSRI